jgi:acetylornithine deacetylase/succinyl-diaminopimelate desuccinylase-like protein
LLRDWLAAGSAAPVDGTGYAVTPALREWYREADTDELEYAAGQAAAVAALRLLGTDAQAPRRRVVLAVDVEESSARPDGAAPAAVTVAEPVPRSAWASALVDDGDAESVVSAAVSSLAAAASGDPDAEFALDEAAAHELGWYAVQELADLLG